MRRSSIRVVPVANVSLLIALAQACTQAGAPGPGDPFGTNATTPLMLNEDALAAVASAPPARMASVHPDGQGRMMLATGAGRMAAPMPAETNGETAARLHLLRYQDELELTPEAIEELVLQGGEHRLPGGAAIYRFIQYVNGLPVFQARANVVLDGARNVVSIANGLVPSWIADAPHDVFAVSPESALGNVYSAAGGVALRLADVTESGARRDGSNEWLDYQISTPAGMLGVLQASARRVMFREEDTLVSAYHVELTTRSPRTREIKAYGFVIAAEDGRLLLRKSLTAHEAFTYRVYAEPTGAKAPHDGPIVDSTPHPTGVPEVYQPAFGESALVEMEGFNKNKDPWLPAEATYTFGNNVHAYSDRNQANGFFSNGGGFNDGTDFRAEVTSPRTFDRKYDPAMPPAASPDQVKAAVTQTFYVTNWLHDFYYDSGFDEMSGVAQESNLGRGGTEGDPLLTEVQDSADNGTANNANMSTPSDGSSPRMQMYVWNGAPNRALETQPPVRFEDWFGSASFSPDEFSLPATELVLVNDGSTQVPFDWSGANWGSAAAMGTMTDACQAPTNVSGKIAVIDRGACTYVNKVQNAQMAGAVGALVINNVPGHTSPNADADAGMQGGIPVLIMSYEDGQRLKAQMLEAPVQATKFFRGPEVKRDGSIDTTVVAHEWGHYMHMRLQDGQSQQYGSMSEGWGDYNALFVAIRETDTFANRAFPLAVYAAGGFDSRASYYGIRRAPYSVEYTINPFTFEHISADAELPDYAPLSVASDNPMNESHAAGEIWAQTMFEAYVNVIETGRSAGRPFDDSRRRMADYVVAGLKAAPDDPTWVEQRDAILSAVRAMAAMDPTRKADEDAIARGFAKRGLGASAVAPPNSSRNLTEAVEAFDLETTSP